MYKPDYIKMGSRIRTQREFLGYTREYVAEKLGVSINFCRDIEIGAKGMSLQTLCTLSSVLKLSTDYILLGTHSDEDKYNPIVLMLKSCPCEKAEYLEEIVRSFLLAVE